MGGADPRPFTLDIHTTTGGTFAVTADASATVDHLKKLVSKRLKVPKERICLLHRDRQLRDGTLSDNGLADGSRVILLPSVETGLLTQRPENSVMQALESLNDSQVNDFLSGKSPLNLTMRLGDHMMLIQLQLSTYPGGGAAPSRPRAPDHKRTPAKVARAPPEPPPAAKPPPPDERPGTSAGGPPRLKEPTEADNFKSFLCKQDIETLQNAFEIFKSLAEMQESGDKEPEEAVPTNDPLLSSCNQKGAKTSDVPDERSPIKSLSNLVSGPMNAPVVKTETPSKFVPLPSSLKSNLISSIIDRPDETPHSEPPIETMTDPIAANLTSCLCSAFSDYSCSSNCHPLDHNVNVEASPQMEAQYKATDAELAIGLPNEYQMESVFNSVAGNQAALNANKMVIDTKHLELISDKPEDDDASNENDEVFAPKAVSSHIAKTLKNKRLHYLLHKTSKPNNQNIQNKPKAFIQSLVNKHIKKKMQQVQASDPAQPSTSKANPIEVQPEFEPDEPGSSKESNNKIESAISPISDTNSLVEASKNLTQTLKKLSKEVLTNKVDLANEKATRPKIGQGAVIESMKHHGKGIYSGTFSGTLNPALQDRHGRPKRDISTIIHILNDLLCATPPQYRRGARITFEPTHNTQPITRTRQRELKQSALSCDVDHTSDECICSKCSSLNLCPYGECNGHYTSPPAADNLLSVDGCSCKNKSNEAEKCDRLTCDSENKNCFCDMTKEHDYDLTKSGCKKCNTSDTLASDNSKTKCKLDQLRLVMQQKKQRREARKIKAAPYPPTPSSSVSINQTDPSNIIVEEIETRA